MRVLTQVALVAFGSALGGLARWGITLGAERFFSTPFPVGTFLINITGSLFLGWLTTVLDERLLKSSLSWVQPADVRLMLAVGFTGAYTTFSTFEYESHKLLRDGDGLIGASYIAGSVFLGLLAVRLGVHLARYV